MTPERRQLVLETWQALEPQAGLAARHFYERLFELDPQARDLFAATDMARQEAKLMDMLGLLVRTLDDEERFVRELADLGRRHAGYGARHRDYDSVGTALLWTLERTLGPRFTPEARDAWAEAYRLIAGVMRRAGAKRSGAVS